VDVREYLRLLRRNWLLVVVLTALGAGVTGAMTWRATPMYASSVTMVVSSPVSADDPTAAYQGTLLSQQRVKSYADMVSSDQIAAAVIRQLGLTVSPASLRSRISAQAVPDTVLLRATVTDRVPVRAQLIANAVGDVFSGAVARVETPPGSRSPSVHVTVWERAKVASSPVSPRPVRTVGLGVLLGLLAGVGAAALRTRLDRTVSGEDDVRDAVGLPVLGAICYDPDARLRPLVVHGPSHAPRAEAFRVLRTNLRFVDVDTHPRTIVVTSALPGEGKTTTSANLAFTLAQAGARVVLVEGDLRRPTFGEYLGVESAVGLTSVLIGAADLDDVLQPWGQDGAHPGRSRHGGAHPGRFDVLPSGPVPPNPSELLGSRGMHALLTRLAARYDAVLVDASPLLPVTDAAVLAAQCDAVLFVARTRRTHRQQIVTAVEALRAVDARLLGVVLNMVPLKGPDAYHRYGYPYLPKKGRHSRATAAPAAATVPAPATPPAPAPATPPAPATVPGATVPAGAGELPHQPGPGAWPGAGHPADPSTDVAFDPPTDPPPITQSLARSREP
jgi:capsular exopolysaccharide synthesis family protein